ncbi:hypothetical protein CPLU01_06231 [Colletotrichum plurivorum]|uniref:Uncharacterized protein n=1 Tax=Colletotrichum plurivorum TaxID=2175906 RepID=A0A8H6KKH8_9PEZI|nr:hypothetical protein CPLU01_06231 [Colletotrichum plurivorum]
MHISAALFLLSATGTLARPVLDSSTWKAILDVTNGVNSGNSVGGQQSANPTPGANPVGGQNWAKRDADPEDLLKLLGPIAGLFPDLPDQKPDAPPERRPIKLKNGGRKKPVLPQRRDVDPDLEELLKQLGPIVGLFPDLPDQKPDASRQRDWKKKKSPHDHLFDGERRLDARDNQDAVNGQLSVSLPPPTDDGLAGSRLKYPPGFKYDEPPTLQSRSSEPGADRQGSQNPWRRLKNHPGHRLPRLRPPVLGNEEPVSKPIKTASSDDGLTETAPEPQLQSRFLRPIMDSFRDAIEEAIRESRKNLPTSPKAEQTPDSSGGDVPSQTAPKHNPLTKAIPQLQSRSVPLNVSLREIFKKLQEAIEHRDRQPRDLQSRSEISDILKRLREVIEKMKPPQQDHASASKRDVSWQLAPGPVTPEAKKSPPGSGDGQGGQETSNGSTDGSQQVNDGLQPGNGQSKGGNGSPGRNQGPPPNSGNRGPSCPSQKRDLDENELARAIVKELLDAGYTAEDITEDLTVMPAPVEKREESDALGRWEKPFRGIREELLDEGYTHEEIDQMIGWTPSPSEGKDGIQW